MDWLPNPSWSANVLRASWVFLSVPAIVLTWGRIILDMRQSWAAELGLYFFHQRCMPPWLRWSRCFGPLLSRSRRGRKGGGVSSPTRRSFATRECLRSLEPVQSPSGVCSGFGSPALRSKTLAPVAPSVRFPRVSVSFFFSPSPLSPHLFPFCPQPG
uniref:Secreted protein n=1 Tax=Knipowitschia caucasica TaxID=637954 RepID=A0AAV2MQ71_KNICA